MNLMDKIEKRLAIVFTLVGGFILMVLFLLLGNGNNEPLMVTIFLSLGIIFLTIGLLITFYTMKREWRIKRIILKGEKLFFDLSSVQIKRLDSCNFYLKIKYSNPVSKKNIVFESKSLAYNPEAFLEDKKITVFVSKEDASKYHIDLSFLPKLINY